MTNQHNPQENYQLALTYHQRMPDRVRAYLHEKGISDPLICRYRLGWNEQRITIPITDKDRNVVFFKLAKDPMDKSDAPGMLASIDHAIELYGWERLAYQRPRLIICEGEFDRLILEARGFPAICSTGGVHVFLPEWADQMRATAEVFVCFRNNAESYDAASGLCALVPGSRIVELPDEVGMDGGIEDFFVRLGKNGQDFEELLDSAYNPHDDR
jgi:DNA primase